MLFFEKQFLLWLLLSLSISNKSIAQGTPFGNGLDDIIYDITSPEKNPNRLFKRHISDITLDSIYTSALEMTYLESNLWSLGSSFLEKDYIEAYKQLIENFNFSLYELKIRKAVIKSATIYSSNKPKLDLISQYMKDCYRYMLVNEYNQEPRILHQKLSLFSEIVCFNNKFIKKNDAEIISKIRELIFKYEKNPDVRKFLQLLIDIYSKKQNNRCYISLVTKLNLLAGKISNMDRKDSISGPRLTKIIYDYYKIDKKYVNKLFIQRKEEISCTVWTARKRLKEALNNSNNSPAKEKELTILVQEIDNSNINAADEKHANVQAQRVQDILEANVSPNGTLDEIRDKINLLSEQLGFINNTSPRYQNKKEELTSIKNRWKRRKEILDNAEKLTLKSIKENAKILKELNKLLAPPLLQQNNPLDSLISKIDSVRALGQCIYCEELLKINREKLNKNADNNDINLLDQIVYESDFCYQNNHIQLGKATPLKELKQKYINSIFLNDEENRVILVQLDSSTFFREIIDLYKIAIPQEEVDEGYMQIVLGRFIFYNHELLSNKNKLDPQQLKKIRLDQPINSYKQWIKIPNLARLNLVYRKSPAIDGKYENATNVIK